MKKILLSHGSNDLYWFILPLILPSLLEKYSLNYTQAGGILTIYLAITALFSFITGKLSDHFSRKNILSYGLILAGLSLISSSFAPTLSLFLILISITGIGVSTYHPVMYAVIDNNYKETKGKVFGIFEGVGMGALLIMFLINGTLFKWIGIRGVLILTALPGLFMGLVYRFSPVSSLDSGKKQIEEVIIEKPTVKDILRFILFLFSIILRIVSVTAILNFLPTIFINYFGFKASTAAYATAFFFAGGIIGALTAGKLSSRFNPLKLMIFGAICIIPSVVLLAVDFPVWIYPLIVILFGSFTSIGNITQNLLIPRFGRHFGKGAVFGILMGIMTLTSSVSPMLFGIVIDSSGFTRAIFLFAFPALFSAIILLILLKTSKTGNKVKVP